ncbi:MAG: AAA family ATPase, partial [Candidatus Sulfotelmatobacter sp.]
MSASDPKILNALASAIKAGKLSKADLASLAEKAYDAEAKADYSDWASKCKTFGQLSDKPPRWLIHNLFPEKALTLIPAPSYNGKTWFSLQSGLSLSTGRDLWTFKGPGEVVPCVYHVPEMNEAFVRDYMYKVGFKDSKDFYVRPMECDMWLLDDPYMLESSKGRYVFLDTMGYFNPADDSASYAQSIGFAKLVYKLLLNGAIGVAALM